jgi:hypothetical protein
VNEPQRLALLEGRLRAISPEPPSPGARLRGWNVVASQLRPLAVPPALRPRLGIAAAIALLLLVAAGGILTVAASSQPDSPLYPVKGVEESVHGALLFNSSDQVAYRLQLAATRLDEAGVMFDRKRVSLGVRALHDFTAETEEAARLIVALRASSPALAAQLRSQLAHAVSMQEGRLDALQVRVQDPAGLNAISEARAGSQQAVTTVAGGPSPGASPSASPSISVSPSSSASASAAASSSP